VTSAPGRGRVLAPASGEGPAKPEPGGPKGPPKNLKPHAALPVISARVVETSVP
jgi:hypothetical protein